MPLPLALIRMVGGAMFRRQAYSTAFGGKRKTFKQEPNGDWDVYDDERVNRSGSTSKPKYDETELLISMLKGAGRMPSKAFKGAWKTGNYLTGNNLVGRGFAGIGDMVLGRKPNFSYGKEERELEKKAAKLAKKNKHQTKEQILDSLRFDHAYKTNFTKTQMGLNRSKGILGLGKERLSGLSLGESNSISSGGGFVSSGRVSSVGSGGAKSVMLLPSPGVTEIVKAQAATTGAVQSSGKDLFQAISGTSKVLQNSGDGKFKEGNPGGKSAIVQELKKQQNQLIAIKQVTDNSAQEETKANTKLSKIVQNTSPDVAQNAATGTQLMLMDGNDLAKRRNQLAETSNKFLAYIAKSLGMRVDNKLKPRRKEALIGMAAVGAVGMAGQKIEEEFPAFQRKIDDLMQWAYNAMKPFLDVIEKSITPIMEWLGEKWAAFMNTEFMKDVKSGFSALVDDISNSGFIQALKPLSDAFIALGKAAKDVGVLLWKVFKTVAKVIYTVFIKPMGVLMRGVVKLFSWVVEKISNFVSTVAKGWTLLWEKIDAAVQPVLEAFNNFSRWFRNSWLGKKMGINDTHDISVVAKAYMGDGRKFDKLIEKQDKIIEGIDYSNKQRQQLDERNRKILEAEQQKNRELSKEQIDSIKKSSSISASQNQMMEKQLRMQTEQLSLQRDSLKGNTLFDIGDDGYVEINDALRQAALSADYDWTGHNVANEEEMKAFKLKQAEDLSTAIINNLKVLSSDEYGVIKGKDGVYNISIDPSKWGKYNTLGIDDYGFHGILTQGQGMGLESFRKTKETAESLGLSQFNYIDDNAIKFLTQEAYSGDRGAIAILESVMKSMDINNNKREALRAERQRKAQEEGESKIKQDFASEQERINKLAEQSMDDLFDQSIAAEAKFFAEKALREGEKGLKAILPETDFKYDEFVKEVKEGKAVDAYQKFILGIDETMIINNEITQKGNEMIVEQLKKIEENTKGMIEATAHYDVNGVTTSAITSGVSMKINGFVDSVKTGAKKIKNKITGGGSSDEYTSTATSMSNIDSSDLDLNTQKGKEELLRRHLVSQGYDHQSTAALMAHAKHESGQFKHMIEQGERSYFNKYEQGKLAQTLGNTQKGDGYKYRGRGYVQLTGRDNYTRAGKALGLDLVNHPELAEDPHNAVRIYEWFIKTKRHGETKEKMMDLIQSGEFRKSTYALNGGYNGWDDRLNSYNKYLKDENLHKAPETIKQESMVADVKKPDTPTTPLIYKRSEEAPSRVTAEASSDGLAGALGSVTRRYNDAVDKKNKEVMQTAIMAMPQPQPVVVNAGGNGGSTTNVVSSTDESIHFAGDIPAAIAQRTLASGFA